MDFDTENGVPLREVGDDVSIRMTVNHFGGWSLMARRALEVMGTDPKAARDYTRLIEEQTKLVFESGMRGEHQNSDSEPQITIC